MRKVPILKAVLGLPWSLNGCAGSPSGSSAGSTARPARTQCVAADPVVWATQGRKCDPRLAVHTATTTSL